MGSRPSVKATRENDYAARFSRGMFAGAHIAVVSLPADLPPPIATLLTPAEQSVATALIAGSTYASIAERRRVSTRTVANQVRAIFKKLGIGSRAELIRRVVCDGE